MLGLLRLRAFADCTELVLAKFVNYVLASLLVVI